MKIVVLFLALLLAAGSALAQRDGRKQQGARPQQHQMRDDERQRMREDIRDAYRERQGRPERPAPMSPQERDKLRRDIEETNRDLRRK